MANLAMYLVATCLPIILINFASAKVPPELILCHRSAPDFQQCLLPAVGESVKALRGGHKGLGLPVLDPLDVPSISMMDAGLKQEYTNSTLSGAVDSDFIATDISITKDDCHVNFKTFSNALTLDGHYHFTGKMMMFTINGHGHANVKMINVTSWHNSTCEFYVKNGKEYMNITAWTEDYQMEKLVYAFDNMIDGNAELSAQVVQVMNDNDLEVFNTLKHGYELSFAEIYRQITNIIAHKVPWEEIFLE